MLETSCHKQSFISARNAQRRDDALRRQRRLDKVHVEGRKRVLDRGDDRRRRRDSAAFAGAFDAKRIEWIDRLDMGDSSGRDIGRHRQQIIGE
jgi:hypothetical protein